MSRAFPDPSIEQLRAAGGSKWTTFPEAIGSFVAESDFGTAPEVLDVLRRRVEDQSLGYLAPPDLEQVKQAVAEWYADRHGWAIDTAQIGVVPEVIWALSLVIEHFTEPGQAIILPTPAYMPFLKLPGDLGRELIQVPGIVDDSGRTVLDLEGIDAAFAAGAGLLILVNPNNPTGTVCTAEELRALSRVVSARGGRVWADEIHSPLVFPGAEHIPYASVSEEASAHTITATSASKGWNIPGLKCALVICSDPDDAARWHRVSAWPAHATGSLGVWATTAAYREGRGWLDDLVGHLDGQRRLLAEEVARHLPEAVHHSPQATYLGWLDLRAYAEGDLGRSLRSTAGVAGTDGLLCGAGYEGFLRLNFATPAAVLSETIARIGSALR